MTDEEHSFVRAFKDYIEENEIKAEIWRDTQHMGSDQKLDIFLDTSCLGYFGIEHKSVKINSSKKLYFTQHFSEKEMPSGEVEHQVDTISDFLENSGRTGFLAIQVRRGRGKPTDTYMLEWSLLIEKYEDDSCAGIDLTLLEDMAEQSDRVFKVPRQNGEWVVDSEVWNKVVS